MEDIQTFLASIGFGKNEIAVYLALVQMGNASVLQIAKRTKIHRSNIYDTLRTLVERGLVYETSQDSTKTFSARPPASLMNYLKRREDELEVILKDFESRLGRIDKPQLIRYTKGVFALREAVYGFLETKKPIMLFGVPGKAPEVIGPMLKRFHEERIKQKIPMLHIYNAESIDRVKYLNKMEYTEARILPKKFDTRVTTVVTGDKVVFQVWDEDIEVIEIQNEDIANTYQNYFDILWKKASVVKE